MNAIAFDAAREELTDCPWCGIGGIGGAHNLAQTSDDVFTFEHHDQRVSGAHERCKAFKERTLAVHGIKSLGFFFREVHQPGRHDLKLIRLENLDDIADVSSSYGIRLNDCKSALYRHEFLLQVG